MRNIHDIAFEAAEMDNIMSVCCGAPRGDELPQVAGINDILADVYSDILNMPREEATGRFHHQFEDDLEYDGLTH